MTKTPFVIGMASNTPDRAYRMEQASLSLMSAFEKVSISAIYETESINGDKTVYFNAVAAAMTDMTPEQVRAKLKQIERNAGRTALSKNEGIVPLDLDLVIWDGRIERQRDFEQPYFNIGYRELLAAGAFQYIV